MKVTCWRRRILVTRPRARAESWAKPLAQRGAEVVFVPTFALQRPDVAARRELIARLLAPTEGPGWLAFTSPSSVEGFFELIASTSRAIDLAPFRIAAVGRATERLLGERGLEVERRPDDAPDDAPEEIADVEAVESDQGEVASDALGAQLARAILAVDGTARVWHVASDQARPELGEAIRAGGGRCEAFTVSYHERLPIDEARLTSELESREGGGRGGLDVLTFGSPSAVQGLFEPVADALRARLLARPCLAIGRTTARELEAWGAQEIWVPERPDIEAVVALLEARWHDVSERDE